MPVCVTSLLDPIKTSPSISLQNYTYFDKISVFYLLFLPFFSYLDKVKKVNEFNKQIFNLLKGSAIVCFVEKKRFHFVLF